MDLYFNSGNIFPSYFKACSFPLRSHSKSPKSLYKNGKMFLKRDKTLSQPNSQDHSIKINSGTTHKLSWKSELKAQVLNQRSTDSSGLQSSFMKPLKSHAKYVYMPFSGERVHTFHQSFKDIWDLQNVKKCSREKQRQANMIKRLSPF